MSFTNSKLTSWLKLSSQVFLSLSHFKIRAEGGFGWLLEKAFLSGSWSEKAPLESILRLILGQTESSRMVS